MYNPPILELPDCNVVSRDIFFVDNADLDSVGLQYGDAFGPERPLDDPPGLGWFIIDFSWKWSASDCGERPPDETRS
jgi:hypothetical protein